MQIDQRRAFFLSVVMLASCLGFSRSACAVVRINELMASNKDTLLNNLDESSDWIELYNDGHETVNIGGMYLTDDMTAPTKWQIPSDTLIMSQGYLIIWADGQFGEVLPELVFLNLKKTDAVAYCEGIREE